MSEPEAPQWHVTWATVGRHLVASDEATRRVLIRVIVERAGAVLVSWCIVDDHVHLVFKCERAVLTAMLRNLRFALAGFGPLAEPHIEPVESRKHAMSLVPYVLTQSTHHGLAAGPVAWTGSCLADLLGARDVGWAPKLWSSLPRLRVRDVHAAVGMAAVPLTPATDEQVRAAGASAIAAAASAAFAADPALEGRAPEVVRAVRSVAGLAREVGLPLAVVARAVGRERETVSRMPAAPSRDLKTLRLRLALDKV